MPAGRNGSSPPDIQSVAALRARLWDGGFRPVPIYNADSHKTHSPGKAPMGDDWGDKARQDPPIAAVAAPHPEATNTGILCDGLRAIDIDIDNPTIAASVRAKVIARFGEAPIRSRADSARCLLVYRAAEGAPTKRVLKGTFGKVEVLGRGQQFVAFGVHPSGSALQWAPAAPGDIDVASLPAITETEIDTLFAECAGSIGGKAEARKTDRVAAASKHGLGADGLQVLTALHQIPNDGPADWEGWNRMGMAMWNAFKGSEAGRSAFHAWSEQNPAYDPTETDRRWDHYSTSPPTEIGAGTVFHIAKEHAKEQAKKKAAKPLGTVDIEVDSAEWEEADLAEREWLVNGHFMRGVVTILAGPPGSGKSLIGIGMAVACALGRDYGRFRPNGRLKVAIYNAEDDIVEQKRRISATLRQFGAAPRDLEGNLLRLFPKRLPELFHWGMNESGAYDVRETPQWKFLIDFCSTERPDILLLDPGAELSTVPGNDNEAQRLVMSHYRALANSMNLAIGLVDHTPKNAGDRAAGDANSVKGAGSKVGSSRIVLTCTVMTEDEARGLGIPQDTRHVYARITDAKHNYSIFNQPQWYEKISYVLANGEEVGAAEPWRAPVPPEMDASQLHEMMEAIGRGSRGEPYSPKLDKHERSVRRLLQNAGMFGPRAEKKVLDQLFEMGLQQVDYRNSQRKTRIGLRTPQGLPRVNWWDIDTHMERDTDDEKARHSVPESAPLDDFSAPLDDDSGGAEEGLFDGI